MKNCATFAVMLLLAGSAAEAGEPDVSIWEIYCNVDFAYEGDGPVTLFNLPDGTGSPFTNASLPDGTIVDATLRVQILDSDGDPIAGYPDEDIWLQPTDGGLVPCIEGTIADADTDDDGWTSWVNPLAAGGFSTGQCEMLISGYIANGWEDLNLRFNSADINGDETVNLVDVSMFASSYFGTYAFEADFYFDGSLNLADVGRLALSMQSHCQ